MSYRSDRYTGTTNRPIVTLCVALFFLTACNGASVGQEHTCKVKGYSYRYRGGIQIEENIPETVEFSLVTFQNRNNFKIITNGFFPEHNNPKILLDPKRSNSAEDVYLYDKIDQENFRTVTSLVLNKVSGDVRIFHHYWIPPKEWKDSDMYMFTGNCRKK